jgi:hypothetical protein
MKQQGVYCILVIIRKTFDRLQAVAKASGENAGPFFEDLVS